MEYKKVNIGLAIEQRTNELGLNKSELARRTGIANQNINRILEKPSIDTDRLISICKALDYNFFQLFFTEETKRKNLSTANTGGVAFSGDNNSGNVGCVSETIYKERVKLLERLIEEKDERINELKERIDELKAK